jgi:hypothetical protein
MSLSDLASLGSFISGIAVLASLVFLYFQVRQVNAQVLQTERNQRALMQQGRAERVADHAMRMAEPALGAIYWKGVRRPEDLTLAEIDLFTSVCRATFLSAEDSVLQHEAGLLDDAAYRSFAAGWGFVVSRGPGIRAAWRMTSQLYDSEFSILMEGLLKEASFFPSDEERLGRWKAVVQSVRSGA